MKKLSLILFSIIIFLPSEIKAQERIDLDLRLVPKKEKYLSIVELKFKKSDDNVLNFMTEMRSKYRRSQISKYTHGLQL